MRPSRLGRPTSVAGVPDLRCSGLSKVASHACRRLDAGVSPPPAAGRAALVGRLGLAWSFDMEGRRGVEATPLMIDGVLYCNDGDWVESCTALVEHLDGRLELLEFAIAHDLQAPPPSTQVAELERS